MRACTLTHLTDADLLRDLRMLVARDRATTAVLLAHLAEVDARRLYAPAGYSSMHAYCVEELGLSEDAAYKRIQAARAARDFPALFPAIAAGELSLSAVCLIAPHLAAANAGELIAAASRQTNAGIREWLACRFPNAGPPVVPNRLRPLPAAPAAQLTVRNPESSTCQLAAQQVEAAAPVPPAAAPPAAGAPPPPAVVERFLLQLTIPRRTHDKLRHAQALLGHAVPSGDMADILDRALDALIERHERRRFGAGARSKRGLVSDTRA